MMLVHHDDPREYVYDTGAENALREADARGWTVISMKEDFVTVFGKEIDIAKGTADLGTADLGTADLGVGHQNSLNSYTDCYKSQKEFQSENPSGYETEYKYE